MNTSKSTIAKNKADYRDKAENMRVTADCCATIWMRTAAAIGM
jgi:hypothetical protein